jgi:hypothetical protein
MTKFLTKFLIAVALMPVGYALGLGIMLAAVLMSLRHNPVSSWLTTDDRCCSPFSAPVPVSGGAK